MLVSRILNLRMMAVSVFMLVVVIVASPNELNVANAQSEKIISSGTQIISSRHEISDLSYNLDSDGNPSTLDQVILEILTPGGASGFEQVYVKPVSNSDAWYTCTEGAGTQWLCDTTSPTVYVADMDQLSVVAVQ